MGRALQSSMAEQQKRSSEMTQEEFLEAQAAETVRMCGPLEPAQKITA